MRPEICIAVESGDIGEVSRLLQAGANVNTTDSVRQTPLSIACNTGNLEIVRILIESGAAVDDGVDKNSVHMTPLMHAAASGHAEIIKLLLDNGAEINRCGIYSALHLGIIKSKEAAVNILLARGADPLIAIRAGAFAGRTAVEEACENGSPSILKKVLEATDYAMARARYPSKFTRQWFESTVTDVGKTTIINQFLSQNS